MRIRERYTLLPQQHLHFRTRLINRHARLEAGNCDRSVMNVVLHAPVVTLRPPKIDVAPDLERLRQDADDLIFLPVEQNIASDRGRVSSKTTLPERVAQQDDCGSVDLIFLGQKRSAQDGANA